MTIACQAPSFMGFSRQEYWSGLPSPPPGRLPNPDKELASAVSPAVAGGFFTTEAGKHVLLADKINFLNTRGGTCGKESTCNYRRSKRCRFHSWVRKIPWKRKWQPSPVFLPGKSHPLPMRSQRVIMTEHTHPSDPRHMKTPVTALL